MVQRSRQPIRYWLADNQGHIRVGTGYKDTKMEIVLRSSRSKKWRTAWKYKVPDDPTVKPMGFGADPDVLYVQSPHQGRDAVFTVDIGKETLEKKLVFSDLDEDVGGGLIVSSKTRGAIGVYCLSDTGRNGLWDASAIAFQKEIDTALPGMVNHIVSTDRDETRHIIYSRRALHPGTYYLRVGEEGTLTKLTDTYPELGPHNLVGKKPVTYTARDGLEIEGHLTLPKGPREGLLPTVIYPHGGPGARDYLAFDLWTEFLASRGYAILQMKFRGSAGYGEEFYRAGLKGWGLAMQDDITDGTKWVIDQGIADPDRICILGASYGGYAALMGAVKKPDLYRCAVSFAGVSDLRMFLLRMRKFSTKGFVKEKIGDPGKDKKRLIATSPAKQVEKIKIPVFIAHGDWDRVVGIEQSEAMVKALKKKGKDYEYLRLEHGDHSLSLQENRTLFFEKLKAFLGKHLGS